MHLHLKLSNRCFFLYFLQWYFALYVLFMIYMSSCNKAMWILMVVIIVLHWYLLGGRKTLIQNKVLSCRNITSHAYQQIVFCFSLHLQINCTWDDYITNANHPPHLSQEQDTRVCLIVNLYRFRDAFRPIACLSCMVCFLQSM